MGSSKLLILGAAERHGRPWVATLSDPMASTCPFFRGRSCVEVLNPWLFTQKIMEKAFPKKHMLTNRDYEQALSCFIPRLFEFCPEPYVCISTLLCECCFCYNNHFGAIGYTRWHRDQLDRGRVISAGEKTSTLRLAHMMYPAALVQQHFGGS